MVYQSSPGADDGWKTANEQFLLDHGHRWLAAFLHTQMPDVPLAQLLQSGRLLGYLAAVVSARKGEDTSDELVAPSAEELLGQKRKPARVLSDVNAFLALAGRLGVDSHDLFSTSDIVEGRNTPQVCRALWSLSRCCQQLSIPGVPPFASPEEEDQWRLLMPQGSALMTAQRYGQLSTRRRSKESLSLASGGSSPVKLDDDSRMSFKDDDAGEQLQGVLDGEHQDSLTDDDPRFRTYSGSPVGPSTPSPFEPALSQTTTMGSPPEALADESPSPPRPRRPEPPRRLSLGFDAHPQEQPAVQRQAVSPVPPHRLGLVRRISTDINTASPPPSPVHPAMLLPSKFAVSAFRGAPPPVPRGVPVDARSREQQDDRVPPLVPLTKLVDSFAAPPLPPKQQQHQQPAQPQPVQPPRQPVRRQLSASGAEAAARASQTAAASAKSAAASSVSAAPGVTAVSEQQATGSGRQDQHTATQLPSLPLADQRARQHDSQQAQAPAVQEQQLQPAQRPRAAAQVAASATAELRPLPEPCSPKQRTAWRPPGIRLLGGKHREVPQFLRHAAIAAAGLAVGHLLQGMHACRSHVSVLDCDAVTKIPKHMLKDAVGPKPRHDPWRTVRG